MTLRHLSPLWRISAVGAAFALVGVLAATAGDAAKGVPQGATQPPVGTAPRVMAAAPGSAEPGVYKIGPEDVLEISVWKNTELTRTVSVRPDGRISMPLLNDVQAANMTPMQLRDALTKGLSTYVADPEVSVIVKEINSVRVSVVGMVRTPGRYQLRSQATILEALAMAGGFTDFAKRDRIVVYRREGLTWKTIDFSYGRLVNDADVAENFVIMPGDIVLVP